MSGWAMLALLLAGGSLAYLGWGFLHREPQYTGFSWLVLCVCILQVLVIGSILIEM